MVCLIEQGIIDKPYKKPFYIEDKAYFQSLTYVNLEGTNIKKIIFGMINEILDGISIYQRNGSLEIHTVDYKPMKGSSYISLPDFIMRRKSNN